MAPRILTRRERAAGRLCTGSLAHLLAGAADWAALAVALTRARVARRRAR